LFVREKYRKIGLGTTFFDHLKQIAREEKCSRMEWTVIDWNQNARNFYTKKIGAKEKTEWVINRLDEEDLLL
jgi:GNAT superfamily N-acetyltransferase